MKMDLHDVIPAIQTWIRMVQEKYRDEINIEFLVEQKDYLRYIHRKQGSSC